jgi:hypothetical protein
MQAEVRVLKSDGGRIDHYQGEVTKQYVGGAIEVRDEKGGFCFVLPREIVKIFEKEEK